MTLLEGACAMADRPRVVVPSLEEVAAVVWSVTALAWCDGPEAAKRWAFAKYRAHRGGAGPTRADLVSPMWVDWLLLAALQEFEPEGGNDG